MSEAGIQTAFVAAMRKLGATVSLITTREAASPHGMAATSVSSLTVDPPALLACVNRSTSLHGPVSRVLWFCVNMLGRQQHELFEEFVKRAGADRFGIGEWQDGPHKLPYLSGAVANIFCSVDRQFDYGTHTIFVGRVEDVLLTGSRQALLYQDGRVGDFSPLVTKAPDMWQVGQVIYGVSDLDCAIEFYRDKLGMRLKFRDADAWAVMDLGGVKLALEATAAGDARRPTRLSLKTSEGLSECMARLKAAGVQVGEPRIGAHEQTMEVTDPDGNTTLVYAPLSA